MSERTIHRNYPRLLLDYPTQKAPATLGGGICLRELRPGEYVVHRYSIHPSGHREYFWGHYFNTALSRSGKDQQERWVLADAVKHWLDTVERYQRRHEVAEYAGRPPVPFATDRVA